MSKRRSKIEIRRGVGLLRQPEGLRFDSVDIDCWKCFDRLLEGGVITSIERSNLDELYFSVERLLKSIENGATARLSPREQLEVKRCFACLDRLYSQSK